MKATLTLAFCCASLILRAQYCIPLHGGQFVEPIVNSVIIGTINNTNNGYPLIYYGYSDYTAMSTSLSAGSNYDLTVTSGAAFQYNFSAWIDFNHDQEFSINEKIGNTIALHNYATGVLNFTVPANAFNGATRLRVRAAIEPFGPWQLSNDPCAPWMQGEAEDYTVNISGGMDNNIALQKMTWPVSAVNLGLEHLSFNIANTGNTPAANFTVNYSINSGAAITETFSGILLPDSVTQFVFSATTDFSVNGCYQVNAWVSWSNDQQGDDDTIAATTCKVLPVSGNGVWYLHSNINGNLEPLGGPPYNSTTNYDCMNAVFGNGNWTQGYLETVDADSLFSPSNCLIFIDGAYEGALAFQTFVNDNRLLIENWVASGGHLFLNYLNDGIGDLIFNIGFNDTKALAQYTIGHAVPFDSTHAVFTGPFLPVIDQWNAYYYSTTILYGHDLKKLIIENDDEFFLGPRIELPLLAEKEWGNGIVLFGTLSPSQLVNPAGTAMNSRKNTLAYLNQCSVSAVTADEPDNFKIFPNPTTDYLNIEMKEELDKLVYTLSDAAGKIIVAGYLSTPNARINIKDLAPGGYLLQWNSGINAGIEKVIIMR